MSVFKTKPFHEWQKKEDIPDKSLCAAVDKMSRGLVDASLGGGLVKKRIARPGAGKSSGFRTLLATNKNDLWFFVYGFAKVGYSRNYGKAFRHGWIGTEISREDGALLRRLDDTANSCFSFLGLGLATNS